MKTIRPWRLAAALTLLAAPGAALPFAEDICYVYRDAGVLNDEENLIPAPFNCYDLTCSDGPGGDGGAPECVVEGLATYIGALFIQRNLRGRNTLHFDVAWLLARAAGLTAEDAMTVATYSEATDLGRYQHYDFLGRPIPSSATGDISGLTRTNADTAGFWLHFPPWYRAQGDIGMPEGLDYDFDHAPGASPYHERERSLNHLRAWAFGQRATLCNFGLTQPDGQCFVDAQDPADDTTLYVSFPVVGPVAQTGTWALRNQDIAPCGNGDPDCYVSDYDVDHAGTPSALGSYLHSMGDRLSHVQCTNVSYIEETIGPKSETDLQLLYSPSCGALVHVAMHYRETGHQPVPGRSVDMVRYTGAEIDDWAETTGYARGAWAVTDPVEQEALWDRIAQTALPEACAADRIAALCEIAKDHGLGWHDGNPSCTYPRRSCNED